MIHHAEAIGVRAGHAHCGGPLHKPIQAETALSRKPESLILDNKISLPFKSCRIPLKSNPPPPPPPPLPPNNRDMVQGKEAYHKSECPGISFFFPLKIWSKSQVLSLWA